MADPPPNEDTTTSSTIGDIDGEHAAVSPPHIDGDLLPPLPPPPPASPLRRDPVARAVLEDAAATPATRMEWVDRDSPDGLPGLRMPRSRRQVQPTQPSAADAAGTRDHHHEVEEVVDDAASVEVDVGSVDDSDDEDDEDEMIDVIDGDDEDDVVRRLALIERMERLALDEMTLRHAMLADGEEEDDEDMMTMEETTAVCGGGGGAASAAAAGASVASSSPSSCTAVPAGGSGGGVSVRRARMLRLLSDEFPPSDDDEEGDDGSKDTLRRGGRRMVGSRSEDGSTTTTAAAVAASSSSSSSLVEEMEEDMYATLLGGMERPRRGSGRFASARSLRRHLDAVGVSSATSGNTSATSNDFDSSSSSPASLPSSSSSSAMSSELAAEMRRMEMVHPYMRSLYRRYAAMGGVGLATATTGGASSGSAGTGNARRLDRLFASAGLGLGGGGGGGATAAGSASSSSPSGGTSPPVTELRRLIRAKRWVEAVERLGLYPDEAIINDLILRVTVLHEAIELDAPLFVVEAIVDAHPTLSHVKRLKDGRTAVHLAVSKLHRGGKGGGSSSRKQPEDVVERMGGGDDNLAIAAVAVAGAKTTGLDDESDCKGGGGGREERPSRDAREGSLLPATSAVRIMLSRSPRAVLIADKNGHTPLHQWATSTCRKDDREHYLQHVDMLRALVSASKRNRSLLVGSGNDDCVGGAGTAIATCTHKGSGTETRGAYNCTTCGQTLTTCTCATVDRSLPSVFAATGTGRNKRPQARPEMALHCLCRLGTAEFPYTTAHSSPPSNNARLSPLLTLEVVRLFLEADPTSASTQNYRADTPLHCLLGIDHKALAESTSTIPPWATTVTSTTATKDQGDVDDRDDESLTCHPSELIPEIVRELLATCPGAAMIQNRYMKTPLHVACEHDAPEEIVALLLEARGCEGVGSTGTTTNDNAASIADGDKRLPLHVACKYRARPGVVRMVLDAYLGAASMKDGFGETPFSYLTNNIANEKAVAFDVIQVVAKATTAEIFTEKCGDDEGAFLHRAILNGASGKVVQVIHEAYPGAAAVTDNRGNTPLHVACQEKRAPMEVTRYLLRVNPAAAGVQNSKDGNTPLHLAMKRGLPVSIAKALIRAAPAALTMKNWRGNTALHLACANGASMMSVIKTMLGLLPDGPSIQNASGKTPLYLASACSSASPRLIGALLEVDETAASVASAEGTLPLLAAAENVAPASAIRELFCNFPDGVMRRNSLGSSTIGAMVQNSMHLRKSSSAEGGMNSAASLSVMREMLELYPAASTIPDASGRSPVCHAFLQFKGTLSIDFREVEKMAPDMLRSMCRGDAWEQLSILLKASFDCHATMDDDDRPLLVVHAICNSDCPLEAMKFAFASRPDELRVRCSGQGWLPLHILAAKRVRRIESQGATPEQGRGGGEGNGREGGGDHPSLSNGEETATDAATEARVAAVELHNKCTHLAIETVLDHYPQGASVPDNEGRVALNLCIESGKGWRDGLKRIMEAAPGALQARDTKTHLYPFMLAASREETTLTDVYELLLSNPETVRRGIV